MRSLKNKRKLSNGYEIPLMGFGTYRMDTGSTAYDSVRYALDTGYRLIDTASYYNNESDVGRAVRASGIPRDEIVVTTKLWNDDQGYESTLKAFARSMDNLGLDYLDLYLIHWPRVKWAPDDWVRLNRETWQAMEELYEMGKIKAIGVSNFKPHHIESLVEMSLHRPMVNQIEMHPGLPQDDTVSYCQENGIVVESWGPLARGKIIDAGLLDSLAHKYGKTPAQIALRWLLEKGVVPLPKSVTPARIVENTQIFDFDISADDLAFISSLDIDTGTGMNPDKTAW